MSVIGKYVGVWSFQTGSVFLGAVVAAPTFERAVDVTLALAFLYTMLYVTVFAANKVFS